tara:strand:+ start:363 stop:581 length:219 start_codon:yes stop_codon:yes gene_type:complete
MFNMKNINLNEIPVKNNKSDTSELEMKTALRDRLFQKVLCKQSYGYDNSKEVNYLSNLNDEIKILQKQKIGI